MALSGQFQMMINLLATSVQDLHTRSSLLVKSFGPTITDGTGADCGQVLYADTLSLADGANTTIDFYDGSLTDVNGIALTMAALKGLIIRNNSADASLVIGGAVATQLALFLDNATDKLILPPGSTNNPSVFAIIVPSATGIVTSTNSDLKLEHNGTGSSTMAVDVIAWGID